MLCFCGLTAQSTLTGIVTDGANGESILFGNVALYQDGVLVTGVETDFDGRYRIEDLEAGTYDVEATYVGLNPERITKVVITGGKVNKLDIAFSAEPVFICCQHFMIIYETPLYEQDNMTSGQIFSKSEIKHSAY